MPILAGIRGPDRFSVFDDVRIDAYLRMPGVQVTGTADMHLQIAETPAERNVLLFADVLAAKYNHGLVVESTLDFREGGVIKPSQIDTADFSTQVSPDPDNLRHPLFVLNNHLSPLSLRISLARFVLSNPAGTPA